MDEVITGNSKTTHNNLRFFFSANDASNKRTHLLGMDEMAISI